VEKPMTHTVEESKVVAHRAKELQRVVQVGVQGTSWTRWHKIHEIIPIRDDRSGGGRAGHIQPQCPGGRLEYRRMVDH